MTSSSGVSETLKSTDLYRLFGISEDATTEVITKAYRKKALTVHPDKNPDNPKAAEMFVLLTEALKILTDSAARAAYNQCQKAKKAAEERNRNLDSKRRKFKEDLEAREKRESVSASARNAFKPTAPSTDSGNSMSLYEKEILRLRKEGNRLVEMEQERLREELKKQLAATPKSVEKPVDSGCRLKIRWKVSKKDTSNSGITEDFLKPLFSQYGPLNFVVISQKKSGSAIVEFRTAKSAEAAVKAENGKMFEITFVDGPSSSGSVPATESEQLRSKATPGCRAASPVSAPPPSTLDEYEAMVFGKIDAAIKRKHTS